MIIHIANQAIDLSSFQGRLKKKTNMSDSSSSYSVDMSKDQSSGSTGENVDSPGAEKSPTYSVTRSEGNSIEDELCMICGDKASGYHYNALSCEGCKGFFRRSVTRGAKYYCKNGGNCEMDMWMRRRCQACRFKRCQEVGMKEECLLSDEQCKARDVRRKTRQKQKKVMEEHQPSPDSNTADTVNDPLESLSQDCRILITSLVQYQDMFELPSEEDVDQVTKVRLSDIGRPKVLNEAMYKQMAEMTVLVTQLVVEFSKHLPGFQSLERDDQIVLLKASACEVMMLRSARRYDLESDTIIFANGMPYTRDNMRYAGLHDYVDNMFGFCRKMGLLGVDNAEYALITAVAIFSERPGLLNSQQVEQCQDVFVNALQAYVSVRRPKTSQHFAKLLMMLTELRELSAQYSTLLFSLKIEKGSLPPLLCEYFDVVG